MGLLWCTGSRLFILPTPSCASRWDGQWIRRRHRWHIWPNLPKGYFIPYNIVLSNKSSRKGEEDNVLYGICSPKQSVKWPGPDFHGVACTWEAVSTLLLCFASCAAFSSPINLSLSSYMNLLTFLLCSTGDGRQADEYEHFAAGWSPHANARLSQRSCVAQRSLSMTFDWNEQFEEQAGRDIP